jgi:hypothetical protein
VISGDFGSDFDSNPLDTGTSWRVSPRPKILKDAGTDYEYRIHVTPEKWNTVYGPTLFGSIDYSNFKGEVHELAQEGSVPREYERLLGEVYFDCLPKREKEYAFEVAKDRV